jgi:hypothetical protein
MAGYFAGLDQLPPFLRWPVAALLLLGALALLGAVTWYGMSMSESREPRDAESSDPMWLRVLQALFSCIFFGGFVVFLISLLVAPGWLMWSQLHWPEWLAILLGLPSGFAVWTVAYIAFDTVMTVKARKQDAAG